MSFPSPSQDSNPAARISRLIAKALPISVKRTSLDAWAAALDVPDGPGLERDHEVVQLLSDCVEELRLLVLQLRQLGVPDGLYAPYIDRLKKAFSAANLTNPWGATVGNFLNSDVMLALAWCSHVVPEDEATATGEELASLADLLGELEAALQAPGLPEYVRATFVRHLVGMRRAIRLAPLRGTGSLKEASRTILADMNIDKDEIRAAAATADKSTMHHLGGTLYKAWKKTAELAGDGEKIAKAGKQLVDFVSDVVEKLPG
ncbi:hypothetical protein J2789_004324 [Variovorax paradoxus]|uniref:hypothetical protein n=1 Tax=Variovorax atrisoli TaxID=3394203 RepID=UPI00119AA2A7|nr:hypothetical protein [Variovorax paradoxus]MDR6521637.1 hypothetical protein [Variovorax paradoxus]